MPRNYISLFGSGGDSELPAAGGGGFTFLGEVAAQSTDASNVTTGTIDATGATLIVLLIGDISAGGTPSDSQSNVYDTCDDTSARSSRGRIRYKYNPSVSSSMTFTVTSATALPSVIALLFSGNTTAAPLDQQNHGDNFGAGSQATGSVTPTTDNQLIITAISETVGAGRSISDSMILTTAQFGDSPAVTIGVGGAYKIQGSATAINPTWTYTFGGADTRVATFKA